MSAPNGDGDEQYCPRCGAVNRVAVAFLGKCHKCSWKIDWVGPLWGVAKR